MPVTSLNLPYLQEFLSDVSSFHSTTAPYQKPELWRSQIPQYSAEYMHALFISHHNSFIRGSFRFRSPISGKHLNSAFTVISRGGGHTPLLRGNTGLLMLWGCTTSTLSDPVVYVGSMDVFGWITHLVIPSLGINACLVPCDEPSWYEVPFDISTLPKYQDALSSLNLPQLENTLNSRRRIILGSSESVGHSLWNDVSGVLTYLRSAAYYGFDLDVARIPYSILSQSISDETLISYLPSVNLNNYENLDTDCKFLLLSGTYFKPLDFTLNLTRIYKLYDSAKHLTSPQIFDQNKLTIWVNIRSPLEAKRPICMNYVEAIQRALEFSNNCPEKYQCSVVIDGWTGSRVQDNYTASILDHHWMISKAISTDLANSAVQILSVVGDTFDKKARFITKLRQESRLLSICQYGSGITFGAVLGNDMCIALHPQKFNDPILGRNGKNNVYPCTLEIDIPTTTEAHTFPTTSNYTRTIRQIYALYPEESSSFYMVDILSLDNSLNKLLLSSV